MPIMSLAHALFFWELVLNSSPLFLNVNAKATAFVLANALAVACGRDAISLLFVWNPNSFLYFFIIVYTLAVEHFVETPLRSLTWLRSSYFYFILGWVNKNKRFLEIVGFFGQCHWVSYGWVLTVFLFVSD